MIPAGHTIEDIKTRERIIRDFYWEWKEKNPSQRKFNLSLKEYINIRMVSIVETSEHAAKSYLSTLAVLQLDSSVLWLCTVLPQSQANRMKKASQTRCLTFAPYAWRRFTPWGVMRCGRGLRATHYIVLPRLTIYAAKIYSFSLFAKPVLINFKKATSTSPSYGGRLCHRHFCGFLSCRTESDSLFPIRYIPRCEGGTSWSPGHRDYPIRDIWLPIWNSGRPLLLQLPKERHRQALV